MALIVPFNPLERFGFEIVGVYEALFVRLSQRH